MWADTLLRAEQLHLLRVLAWAALTILVGTALVVAARAIRGQPTLLRELGASLALVGLVEIVVAGVAYRSAGLVDVAGAARLVRMAWLELGLFIGGVATGAVLATAGWRLGPSRRALAAGLALAIHGAGLAALTLVFIPAISR